MKHAGKTINEQVDRFFVLYLGIICNNIETKKSALCNLVMEMLIFDEFVCVHISS